LQILEKCRSLRILDGVRFDEKFVKRKEIKSKRRSGRKEGAFQKQAVGSGKDGN
jgi:hypothetical protein